MCFYELFNNKMKIPEYTRSVYRILKITTFYNNQYIHD